MFRIVNHPCLGQTRLALAKFNYQAKDPITCRREIRVEYFHNDGNFYPWPHFIRGRRSHIHCPAAFSCTSKAEQAFTKINLSGV